ncbi:unnamed protein product [Effrenium voratum]|uniref:Uncharacterized protein n=1 Tax=Effrenium voratum TaxID=2562239 RepID=A0AA36JKX5_9DINO|nr:unnamed protein product [Effrenium voratum]
MTSRLFVERRPAPFQLKKAAKRLVVKVLAYHRGKALPKMARMSRKLTRPGQRMLPAIFLGRRKMALIWNRLALVALVVALVVALLVPRNHRESMTLQREEQLRRRSRRSGASVGRA